MYEAMEVYPMSWTFYITFIFFTAFPSLNMVIGIVVNEEQQKLLKQKPVEAYEPDIKDLMVKLESIEAMIKNRSDWVWKTVFYDLMFSSYSALIMNKSVPALFDRQAPKVRKVEPPLVFWQSTITMLCG